MTHSQLVNIAYRWVLKASCGIAYKELKSLATTEIPDVIGFGGWIHSVLIECKVCRSDFKRNAKKNHKRPLGRYRFFCVPLGMISINELPEGWGLIEVNDKGKIEQVYNPFNQYLVVPPSVRDRDARHQGHETDFRTERNFLYSCLRRSFKRNSETIQSLDQVEAPALEVASGVWDIAPEREEVDHQE
ncbi:hypothetical protein [Sphingobacterium suaedae]|uniref:Uncharacterized protein n=1 Tax=Sphingobacterium suaedae TaxID=1686402 RepID=A0ABW5KH54_9SPHI